MNKTTRTTKHGPLLCIGIVNAFHLFIDIDVGWPDRLHDKRADAGSGDAHRDHFLNQKYALYLLGEYQLHLSRIGNKMHQKQLQLGPAAWRI